MNNQETEIKNQLKLLQDKVEALKYFFYQDLAFSQMVYPYWSAKDVLGHLTFWHESFARNLKDLAEGRKPNPLKGKLSEVNQQSVQSTRECSINDLLKRLSQAQKIIENNIGNRSVSMIPYKKGSRDYSKLEHLLVVTNHINKHLNDLNKKLKNNASTKDKGRTHTIKQ